MLYPKNGYNVSAMANRRRNKLVKCCSTQIIAVLLVHFNRFILMLIISKILLILEIREDCFTARCLHLYKPAHG